MRKLAHTRILTTFLGIALALALLATLRTAPAAANPTRLDGTLGTWHFQYFDRSPEPDGARIIDVDYPRGTDAEVRAAAAAMNARAVQLALGNTPFQATIVFAQPLSTAEFGQFVAATGIAPRGSVVRAVQPEGVRVTMGVPPVWGRDAQGLLLVGQTAPGQVPFNQVTLDNMQQKHPQDRVLGIVSTDVTLDAATYAKVRGSSSVFAVDVLQGVVLKAIQARHSGVPAAKINVRQSRLYWAMEDVGLVTK